MARAKEAKFSLCPGPVHIVFCKTTLLCVLSISAVKAGNPEVIFLAVPAIERNPT